VCMRMMNKQTVLLILLGLLVTIVLVPTTPTRWAIPSRDAGVFLYIGEQILNGKIPYRDVWDHKPPAIYYINALGLLIGKGSRWGVWFLEFLSLYFAGVLGFILMKRAFGIVPAIFGSIAWLASSALLLEGGNFTEEFALPFQFATLYLFWQSEKRGYYSWRGFLIGLTFAASFLLKPNLVGVQLSIIIFLLLTRLLSRHWYGLLTHLATIFLGAISIGLIVVIYFAAHNALGSLWDAVFRYNLAAYSTAALGKRLEAIFVGLRITSQSGISIIAITSWIAEMFFVLYARHQIEEKRPLLCVSLIGLPVEFFLATISGRSYSHYYIAWLPMFAILTSFSGYVLRTSAMPQFEAIFGIRKVTSATICLVVLLLAMSFLPARLWLQQIVPHIEGRRHEVVGYIRSSTIKSDYVLMWGAETNINFLTHRQSPTRFTYQYPLYTRGYHNAEMIEQFLQDIVVNRPTLIIDASPSSRIIPPIDPIRRERWTPPSDHYGLLPEMHDVFEYIASNYKLVGTIGQEKPWFVYMYVGKR